jgi:hypothetical protein
LRILCSTMLGFSGSILCHEDAWQITSRRSVALRDRTHSAEVKLIQDAKKQ